MVKYLDKIGYTLLSDFMEFYNIFPIPRVCSICDSFDLMYCLRTVTSHLFLSLCAVLNTLKIYFLRK